MVYFIGVSGEPEARKKPEEDWNQVLVIGEYGGRETYSLSYVSVWMLSFYTRKSNGGQG